VYLQPVLGHFSVSLYLFIIVFMIPVLRVPTGWKGGVCVRVYVNMYTRTHESQVMNRSLRKGETMWVWFIQHGHFWLTFDSTNVIYVYNVKQWMYVCMYICSRLTHIFIPVASVLSYSSLNINLLI
jgi:hypothetical protein